MKYSVKIVIPYFGKFPDSIGPFLESCRRNPEFQWLFFTDDVLKNVPCNVQVINCTLQDVKKKLETAVGFSISLEKPYKLCDFRPAFGLAFSEYLRDVDFWGWGDIDLVYGNLSMFITESVLEQYDKVYPCGHLSLIRNVDEINKAFMLDVSGTLEYKEVFTDPKSFIFDEYKGLNEKLQTIGKKVYTQIDFADMDIVYRRFRTADWRTIKKVFPNCIFRENIPENGKYQLFCYEDGRAYQEYLEKDGQISRRELVYIHYRHKISCTMDPATERYYITAEGFINKTGDTRIETIQRWNPYPGRWTEEKEYFRFWKERLIVELGKNQKLRNFVRKLKGKTKL